MTEIAPRPLSPQQPRRKETDVSILWIILIVIIVLALFGFIGRGRM